MHSSLRRWGPLAVVLAVGAALRLVAVGDEALWTDEALTGAIALHPPLDLALEPIDPTGPLYYWLYRLLVPEGADAVAARLLSVAAGLITIPLVFGLGKRLADWRAGLIAAALVALSAPLIDYSQEARSYALLLMLISGSAWALAGLFRMSPSDVSPGRPILFAGLTLGAVFTHVIGLLWAGAALVILYLASARAEKGRVSGGRALALIAFVALISLVEVVRLVRYTTQANGFTWLRQPGPLDIIQMVASQWLPFGWVGTAAAIAGGLLVAIVIWQVRRRLREWARRSPMAALLISALLLQPLFLWLVGYLVSPIVMPRTILPSAIGFALLLAIAVTRFPSPIRWGVGGVAISATLASTLFQGTVRAKEDWHGAASAAAGASLVVICPLWKGISLLAADAGGAAMVVGPAGRSLLLVRSDSTATEWDRAYFERVSQPLLRIWEGQEVGREQVLLETDSLTLVTSECSPKDRALVRNWFKPTAVELLFKSDGPGAVSAERWARDTPRPLQVIVLD